MDMYRDFTVDSGPGGRYEGMPEYVNEMRESHRHYVPMIDAGISNIDEDETYQSGTKADVWIGSPTSDDEPFVG